MAKRPEGLPLYAIETSVNRAHTSDGRPIRELVAPADIITQAIAAGVPMETKKSLLPDSRHDVMVHVSALQVVGKLQPQLFTALDWVRQRYYGATPPAHSPLTDVAEMSAIAEYMTHFLITRATAPADPNGIPLVVGNLHKVAAGLNLISEVLLTEDTVSEQVHPTDIYTAANDKGMFIVGPRGCPAPEGMVTNAAAVLIAGLPPQHRVQETVAELDSLFPQFLPLQRFSQNMREQINENEERKSKLVALYEKKAALTAEPQAKGVRRKKAALTREQRQLRHQSRITIRIHEREVNELLGRRPVGAINPDLFVQKVIQRILPSRKRDTI